MRYIIADIHGCYNEYINLLKKINFSKKCFGISTPEQAARMAEKCDGVIVGSAIVKLCGQYGKDCVPYVEKYVKSIKDAIRV